MLRWSIRGRWTAAASVTLFALLAAVPARAQSNTRLLLAAGWGVPGHTGFAFGQFSGLAMNEAKEIVFLTTLRSARRDLRAVVRSSGVTFSVVAFEGLRGPIPRTSYDSFSAPSLNNSGIIAFTAAFKDGDAPSAAVVRVDGNQSLAVASAGGAVPGIPEATFAEFSAPLVSSTGNVLFAARLAGPKPSSGLFLWTPRGTVAVPLPPEIAVGPADLLTPVFFSHDEAVFVRRGTPLEAVTEQFFRAVATRNFEDLNLPPEETEVVEILPARPDQLPVRMLFVLIEGDTAQTGLLAGDPSKPVKAKLTPGAPAVPLSRIQGQTSGPRGNIIIAAAPLGQEFDLGLYCYCDGQLLRLTAPEEMHAITAAAQGRPLRSLVGDGERTAAFLAPLDEGAESTALYVTSLP